ncbi:MAG: thioredoxin domain-containing protein [Bacillota bacterium]
MEKAGKNKPNRLVKEKSPYLLQHAYNPVDWFPWGDEAFEKAKKENKPVFLSIGYSTCHWCHVMEKDSFEDQEVAALINEHFIPIKVDREERPDLDQKYMAACQALTGQGGWPLTVFLTPDKKPFYAGTFFPKRSRYGINGMMEILPKLSAFWKEDRDRVIQAGNELTSALTQMARNTGSANGKVLRTLPGADLLDRACKQLKDSYDKQYSGFGEAPKFPAPHQLIYLVRCWNRNNDSKALEMAVSTLRAMHRGGIFDQIGYGLHRYSVDRRWLVPHFEKMLYDQALVVLAALEAYKSSGEDEMAIFARKVISYVMTELASPEGAFFAAEDADSEGEEGTFYVWRPEELIEALGKEQGSLVSDYFGVTEKGNFEKGKSIFHRVADDDKFATERGMTEEDLAKTLELARTTLLKVRSHRERPFRDDKIITSWNGLIIAALARAAYILQEPDYLRAAEKAVSFITHKMVSPDGRLLRRYREGEAAIPAFLDDYANLTWGFLEIYRSSSEPVYLERAENLSREMLDLFMKEKGILQYSNSNEEPEDFALEAEASDSATPSGVSVAAMNLLRLGRLLQQESMVKIGRGLIKSQQSKLERFPTSFTYLLTALDYALSANGENFYCTPDGNCGEE